MSPSQNTEHRRRDLSQFENALALLDEKLGQMQTTIEIKAIGGFALLKYGIRETERAFTVDIDTVTRDYEKRVVDAIAEVASEADLDQDWLNNYNVIDNDPASVEEMIEARWAPQQTSLRNIRLSIADVPTLTRAKLLAAVDAEFSGREQDMPDLLALLRHQGIKNLQELKKRYPDQFGEYEELYAAVGEQFRDGYRSRHPELFRPAAPDFTEDGAELDY